MATRLAAAGLCALLLASCGGGGGSGGGGGGSARADLIATPASLTVSEPVNATLDPVNGFPSTTIHLSIARTDGFLVGTFTSNGIREAVLHWDTGTAPWIEVSLHAPEELAPGTYNDTIVLRHCSDQTCSTAAWGSVSIPVTYTITAPSAGHVPAVTLGPQSLDAQLLSADYNSVGPPMPITLTFTNFGSAPQVKASFGGSAVQIANVENITTVAGTVTTYLRGASALGMGDFTDTLQVTVCLDFACVNPVAGSPFSIPVHVRVSDRLEYGGANGYTLRYIQLPGEATSMVWDPHSAHFYFGMQHDGGGNGYVLSFDPVTASFGTPLRLASDPNSALAVSDDGAYLYAGLIGGSVARLTLPDLATTTTIPLTGLTGTAIDIAVAHGAPATFAVALSDYPFGLFPSGNMRGIAVFDGAQQRPNVFAVPFGVNSDGPTRLLWDTDDSRVFGASTQFAAAATASFQTFGIDANGVSGTAATAGVPGGTLSQAGALVYTSSGAVVAKTGGILVATVQDETNNYGLVPDAANNRLFYLGGPISLSPSTLRSYRLDTRAPIATLTLPSITTVEPTLLARWGAHGLAFVNSSGSTAYGIVLVEGAFVAP